MTDLDLASSPATETAAGGNPALAALLEQAAVGSLKAAWEEILTGSIETEPSLTAHGAPHLWRWAELRSSVLAAAELVPLGKAAQRRAFFLSNPLLRGSGLATSTIGVAVQCLLPGDVSSCHRHSYTAIRFVVEGGGAYTSVDGEPIYMESGELMLTPSLTWHDNAHEGATPIIWLDFLDMPLVSMLNSIFFEFYESARHPLTSPAGWSSRRYGAAALRPRDASIPAHNPLLRYPWPETSRALEDAAATGADPFDGAILEYVDPRTGGPISPTLSAHISRIEPGQVTASHRHTSTVCYHVRSGTGTTMAGSEEFAWGPGDVLVIPGWHTHCHRNDSASEPAVLFSVSDAPALRALGLHREEPAPL